MGSVSKLLFEEKCADRDCFVLMHPFNESCIGALKYSYLDSTIGSAKFYLPIYVIQILMRGKKMNKKEEWYKMLEYYVRSTVLGLFISGTSVTFGCIIRRILGNKFHYYTYILLPTTLNGLFIYLEPPHRRGLVINLFFNLAIEFFLNKAQRDGLVKIKAFHQVLMFMIGNAFLFYLMRLEGDKKERTPLFWLYTPEKVRRKEEGHKNVCPHNSDCLKYIAKGSAIYFGVGAALGLAKIIIPNLKSPIKLLSSIKLKNFKMAMFFASYVGIYRAVTCYLCRKNGKDSALYALPAGALSGLSFIFNPNLSFSITVVTAAAKLYCTILYRKKMLPKNIPLPEILYCICQGILFNARFMHADVCPPYMLRLLTTVSNNRSDQLYANMMKCLNGEL